MFHCTGLSLSYYGQGSQQGRYNHHYYRYQAGNNVVTAFELRIVDDTNSGIHRWGDAALYRLSCKGFHLKIAIKGRGYCFQIYDGQVSAAGIRPVYNRLKMRRVSFLQLATKIKRNNDPHCDVVVIKILDNFIVVICLND